jgi:putative ABC transport system ATP-binding protein
MNHRPSELSGGEQQRVAIARALINRPQLLLADEPTGNLDQTNAQSVMTLLLELQSSESLTLVLVTHDPLIAAQCDRVCELHAGVVMESHHK